MSKAKGHLQPRQRDKSGPCARAICSLRLGCRCSGNFCVASVEPSGSRETAEGGGERGTVSSSGRGKRTPRKDITLPRFSPAEGDRHGSSTALAWALGNAEPLGPRDPSHRSVHFNNIPGDSRAGKSQRSSSLERGRSRSCGCARERGQGIKQPAGIHGSAA